MRGTIEYDNFVSSCQYFAEKTKQIDPGWQLRSSKYDQKLKYLEKRSMVINQNNQCHNKSAESKKGKEDFTVQNADEADAACVKVVSGDGREVMYMYHIIYNASYSVPVLYFTAMTKDGKSLELDEIWGQVPDVYGDALVDKWSFLTQTEHPLLGYPVFHIHPCNTAKMMGNLLPVDIHTSKHRYVPLWLSAVGPLVGLHLATDLFTEEKELQMKSNEN
ncbi:ubiquitin-like-conjugating enzyme ATG10 [Rhopilema esculentum]|uniref:ubiquitin-like-conjugating enzyme ATG10 n=1 Tax=Rhopilema esculentum TaxID=499914 RepID=UPI0031D550FF|eukprot:gene4844-21171_t